MERERVRTPSRLRSGRTTFTTVCLAFRAFARRGHLSRPHAEDSGLPGLRKYHASARVCEPVHMWDNQPRLVPPRHDATDRVVLPRHYLAFLSRALSASLCPAACARRSASALSWRQIPVLLGPRIRRLVVHIDRDSVP